MKIQHPAAKAAQEKAVFNAEVKEVMAQKEVDLTNTLGLRFLHIRDNRYRGEVATAPNPKGGATVAYRFVGRDCIEVAVATCHKDDLYSKPEGRLQAALGFDAGRYIMLRIPKGLAPTSFLKATFGLAAIPTFQD